MHLYGREAGPATKFCDGRIRVVGHATFKKQKERGTFRALSPQNLRGGINFFEPEGGALRAYDWGRSQFTRRHDFVENHSYTTLIVANHWARD